MTIPDTDIGNLDTFLYWTQNPMMYTRPSLDGLIPYVDLWFGIINASVFNLTLERFDGRVHYNGQPLRAA